ncbi:hypothetical protein B0A49_03200 [Cryomyces minteri]|uniref:SWIM-type domain-containing protein n=1 Tax=Cryomyces minteri TaxID=331657 RepID=A0A4U0XHI0_9PEZI|nr:hypothetical protein B0A49_03200 [Cryomyces minteri]
MPTTPPSSRQFLTSLLSSFPSPGSSEFSSNPLRDVGPQDKNVLLTLHVLFPNEFLPALDLLDRRLVSRLVVGDVDLNEHEHESEGEDTVREPQTTTTSRNAEDGGGARQPIDLDLDNPKSARQGQERVRDSSEKSQSYAVYYVRSAQPQPYRSHSSSSRYDSYKRRDNYEHTTHYEVRLTAWNCSCPAFAFSAFPSATSSSGVPSNSSLSDVETVSGNVLGERAGGDWEFGGLDRRSETPVCKHLLACVLEERCPLLRGFVEERRVSVEEAAGWAAGWGG